MCGTVALNSALESSGAAPCGRAVVVDERAVAAIARAA
jgi:hypothetical protein